MSIDSLDELTFIDVCVSQVVPNVNERLLFHP